MSIVKMRPTKESNCPPLTYIVVKSQLLSYNAYMMWEIKDPLSQ